MSLCLSSKTSEPARSLAARIHRAGPDRSGRYRGCPALISTFSGWIGLVRFPWLRSLANVARRAPLAQLAEQLTLNQRVGGSIPSRRTM